MSNEEIDIAKALASCGYLPGSFEKRFARDMGFYAENKPETELTEKQKEQLYRQLKRYRKQIPYTYKKYGRE